MKDLFRPEIREDVALAALVTAIACVSLALLPFLLFDRSTAINFIAEAFGVGVGVLVGVAVTLLLLDPVQSIRRRREDRVRWAPIRKQMAGEVLGNLCHAIGSGIPPGWASGRERISDESPN